MQMAVSKHPFFAFPGAWRKCNSGCLPTRQVTRLTVYLFYIERLQPGRAKGLRIHGGVPQQTVGHSESLVLSVLLWRLKVSHFDSLALPQEVRKPDGLASLTHTSQIPRQSPVYTR